MRCGAIRRLLVVVTALGAVPAILLIVGSGVTRHRYQLDALWGPDPAWLSRMAARMATRRAGLREACRQAGLDQPGNDSLHQPDPWEYLISRKHRLVWCNVFKAASTSWMYNFNILAGYTPSFLKHSNAVPLQLARQRYPRPSLQSLQHALNSSLSFLIARHPLERLLSAYRDKLQNSLPHTHHQMLGTKIISKYRDYSRDGMGSRDPTRRSRYIPRYPTFSEFVHYLVDEFKAGRRFDMHWTPIAEFCTPCQLPPDIIAKFETLEEDQNYLIYKAKLQDYIHPEWKNPTKGRTPTATLARTFYSQLTQTEILQLYDIYRHDFQLFGYNLDGYLELGVKDSQTTVRNKNSSNQKKVVGPQH